MASSGKKHHMVYDFVLEYISKNNLVPGNKLPTEMEISELLKVSRTTVQRSFRELVDKKVAYRVQGGGTYLANQPQNIKRDINFIPIVMSNQQKHTGCYHYVTGAEKFLSSHSCYLAVRCSNTDFELEKDIINSLVHDGNRSIMILSSESTPKLSFYHDHMKRGVNFTFIDRLPMGLMSDLVGSDNITAGFLACEHLINLGHRRICYLCGDINSISTIRERFEGYRSAINLYGLSYGKECFIFPCLNDNAIKESIINLFTSPIPPTAIIASSDSLAAMCIMSLTELGIDVPGKISVVGFDGAEISSGFKPSITTIEQSFFDIGFHAAELAYNRICTATPDPIYTHRSLPVRLVINETTAPPCK